MFAVGVTAQAFNLDWSGQTVSPATTVAVGNAAMNTARPTSKNIKDVFFDYNKASIRSDEEPKAQHDAAFLLEHPQIKVLVEGHCDDRGSAEYNLALGASRAESVKQALLQQGVSADRVKTVSFGKEKPFCTQDNEQCWQQNRVDHLGFAR